MRYMMLPELLRSGVLQGTRQVLYRQRTRHCVAVESGRALRGIARSLRASEMRDIKTTKQRVTSKTEVDFP